MASAPISAQPATPRETHGRARSYALLAIGVVAAALPLVGLVSLLLRSELDPHIENYQLHFVVFGLVGAVAVALGYAAGEAANRRGDARVLLLSLAFMATGGFLWLHAIGTPTILFSQEHAGFQVAIPVGLLVSAIFAAGSAFVDVRPEDRRSADSAPCPAPDLGAGRDGRVVRLDGREPAAVRGARHRGGDEPPGDGAGDRRDDRLRGQRRALLEHLPEPPEPAADHGHRLLPAPVRGDDRRRGHGRAQVARELVGVARPDRCGVRDRRPGRPARMARRAVPAPVPADDARPASGGQRPLRRSRRLHEPSRSGRRRPRSRPCSTPTGAPPRR